jgi:ABC-2 type transport system permease protein
MRKIFSISINDLIVLFRDPGFIVGAFATPAIMGIILGFAFGGGEATTQIRVDVIDGDNSTMSAEFLAEVRAANASLVLCPMDNTEDDFCGLGDDPVLTEERSVGRLTNNDTLALIEIPAGFQTSLESGEPSSIIYRSNENLSAPSFILQAVQAATQKLGGALVAADVGDELVSSTGVITFEDEAAREAFHQSVYDRAAALWETAPFSVDFQASTQGGSNEPSTRQQGFGQSIPGMGSMFVLFFTLLSSVLILRERKNWTIQRLVTMPVSRAQILTGKIITYVLMGMMQFAVLFIVGMLFGLHLGGDILALVLVMLSFTICTTALGFFIGTFIRSEMQGGAMLNLLGLTLAPLGGAWWPLDIVPDVMKTVGHLSPIAWAMDGFHTLLYNQGTLGDVLLPIGVLLGAAVVLFVLAIMRFKFE